MEAALALSHTCITSATFKQVLHFYYVFITLALPEFMTPMICVLWAFWSMHVCLEDHFISPSRLSSSPLMESPPEASSVQYSKKTKNTFECALKRGQDRKYTRLYIHSLFALLYSNLVSNTGVHRSIPACGVTLIFVIAFSIYLNAAFELTSARRKDISISSACFSSAHVFVLAS